MVAHKSHEELEGSRIFTTQQLCYLYANKKVTVGDGGR